MLLLIAFAFAAGVVTVLSPCILPVLPVVLSGSVGGGKARPWGIITGFTLSFTTFTLTLSALVQALGINPDLMRWIAAGLILVFGVVLVVPLLKDWFSGWSTQLLSRTTTATVPGKKPRAGFWGGLVLGLGLGLVWTPCVGPIMASVITLALTRSVDAGGLLITLSYSLGTSVPLFLIMQGGRTLLNRFPWFTRHSSGIQRGFGVLMVMTSVALFTGADRTFSSWLLTTFPSYGSGLTSLENQAAVRDELAKRQKGETPLPGVTAPATDPLSLGQGAWINSDPLTLDGLKGKVVLVDFWTYSCINCVRTLPYLRAWYDRYHSKGLEIVGVHSPEFAFERSETNVRQAVKELKVTWPVVQDNGFGIWNAYQNQFWPAHYLYDRTGALVETHFGEGVYAETEAAIAKALGEPVAGPVVVSDAIPIAEGTKTPETYLGYGRGERFASPEDVAPDQEAKYTIPTDLRPDHWAYSGPWKIRKDGAEGGAGSSLALRFQGQRVYLVIHPVPGKTGSARVVVDGLPVTGGDVRGGVLTPDTDRLYQVVDQKSPSGGLLRVDFSGPVVVFAFTFG